MVVAAHAADPTEVAETFSTYDLVHATDLSYRQVDYWCRIGLLVPFVAANGSGSQRRFDERELRVAVVCGVLSELGCPLTEVASVVAAKLRRDGVPDHGSIFVRSDGAVMVDACDGSGWTIDLDGLGFARESVDA